MWLEPDGACLHRVRSCETVWVCSSYTLKGLRKGVQNETHILRRGRKEQSLIKAWASEAAICIFSDSRCQRISCQSAQTAGTYEGGLISNLTLSEFMCFFFLLTSSRYRSDLWGKKSECVAKPAWVSQAVQGKENKHSHFPLSRVTSWPTSSSDLHY